MEVLQTSALPLGYAAPHGIRAAADPVPMFNPRGIDKGNGAGNGIRTRDFNLGKVALYL
jgi:hypothetical protein